MYDRVILLKLEAARLELATVQKQHAKFEAEFKKDFVDENRYRDHIKAKLDDSIDQVHCGSVELTKVEQEIVAPFTKKLYRRLAKKLHPDLNPGDAEAEEAFKECATAYEEGDIAKVIQLASVYDIEMPYMNADVTKCLVETINRCIVEIEQIKHALSWRWCTSNKNDETRERVHELLGINTEKFKEWLWRRERLRHVLRNTAPKTFT